MTAPQVVVPRAARRGGDERVGRESPQTMCLADAVVVPCRAGQLEACSERVRAIQPGGFCPARSAIRTAALSRASDKALISRARYRMPSLDPLPDHPR